MKNITIGEALFLGLACLVGAILIVAAFEWFGTTQDDLISVIKQIENY